MSEIVLGRQWTYGQFDQPKLTSLKNSFKPADTVNRNILLFYTRKKEAEIIMSRQTQPRQNYHEESEAAVNRQINLELYASYVYQSMVSKIWMLKTARFIPLMLSAFK